MACYNLSPLSTESQIVPKNISKRTLGVFVSIFYFINVIPPVIMEKLLCGSNLL